MVIAPLSARERKLIEDSFARVRASSDAFGRRFYELLFEAHPEFRAMFRAGTEHLIPKLAATLALVVVNLDAPQRIGPTLRALSSRHAGIGVDERDYAPFMAALIEAIAGSVGDLWSTETELAWERALEGVLAAMRGPTSVLGLTPYQRRLVEESYEQLGELRERLAPAMASLPAPAAAVEGAPALLQSIGAKLRLGEHSDVMVAWRIVLGLG